MRFLFISPFDLLAERLWGPSLRLAMIAREIQSMGHTVSFLGQKAAVGEVPQEILGLQVEYLRGNYHRYPYLQSGKEMSIGKQNKLRSIVPLVMKRYSQMSQLIKTQKIDVLVLNRAMYFETSYPTLLVHWLKRVPFLYDWDDVEGFHGFASLARIAYWKQMYVNVHETGFARLSDAVVVASDFLSKYAYSLGVPKELIFYAPTVADQEHFNPQVSGDEVIKQYELKKKHVLVYCGNLMSTNGVKVENILYTVKILLKDIPDVLALIVGEGDLIHGDGKSGALQRLALELGISKNVIFTGGVPYQDVPKYIAAGDLCLALFPVNVVTMAKSPLKIFEYMASGKPLVARAVGEINQVVSHERTGFLVHSDEPQEYAAVIKKALKDETRRLSVGAEARKLVAEKFSWRQSAEAVLKAAEYVCKRRKH